MLRKALTLQQANPSEVVKWALGLRQSVKTLLTAR
jgi:hypothetical protein